MTGAFEDAERLLAPLWDADPATLGADESAALLVWQASGLVDNGGLPALVDGLGPRSDEVVAAFGRLGLRRRAAVLADGLALLPRRRDADAGSRLAVPLWRRRGLEDRLAQAEQRFYALDEVEPVADAVVARLRGGRG
jgi:hypothetical protein